MEEKLEVPPLTPTGLRKDLFDREECGGLLGEIHARMSESPRQRLATDLLNILTANPELVQSGVQGATWKDLPEMAEKCLAAAGKIYPEPARPVPDEVPDSFHAEILRQHATMEGIIKRLDTDVEARRTRWGGLDRVPINPGGSPMPLGAIGADPETYFARPQPGLERDRLPLRDLYEHDGRPTPTHAPLCGAVDGPHVCTLAAGHRGDHASESGLVGWSWPKREPTDRPMGAMTTAVTDHLDDDEPRDSGAHPGVMLNDDGFIDPGVEGEPPSGETPLTERSFIRFGQERSCPDSSLLAYGAHLASGAPIPPVAVVDRSVAPFEVTDIWNADENAPSSGKVAGPLELPDTREENS